MSKTIQALLEVLVCSEKLNQDTRNDTKRRVEMILKSGGPLVYQGFRILLFCFDWAAVLYKFERFTNMVPKNRQRYIRFWAKSKISVLRNVYLLIKTVIISTYYDKVNPDDLGSNN